MSAVAEREPNVPGARLGLSAALSLTAGRLDAPLAGKDSGGSCWELWRVCLRPELGVGVLLVDLGG